MTILCTQFEARVKFRIGLMDRFKVKFIIIKRFSYCCKHFYKACFNNHTIFNYIVVMF